MINQAVMPPLGLWYIADALKGHDVSVIDMGLGDEIPKGADVYGVTGSSVHLKQITDIISELRNESGLKVIGGHHASLKPKDMMGLGFDTVVVGEGDEVIGKIVDERLTGIIATQRITNLDSYFPDRRQEGRYHYEIDGLSAVTIVTSRGCPFHCAFCSKEIFSGKRISRSTESVMTEIESIMDMGYEAVMFFDETFMADRKRLVTLCDEFWERELTWRCLARADDMDKDILTLMKNSGCREIGVGVESGSQRILDNIQKHETVKQQARCIKLAHEAGLRVKAFMIVGLPGESWETIDETDKFLAETQPDALDISILSVYPGSSIYQHPERYDVKFGPPTHFKGKSGAYVCTVSTSHMTSEEILCAHDMLCEKYN